MKENNIPAWLPRTQSNISSIIDGVKEVIKSKGLIMEKLTIEIDGITIVLLGDK